jgi:hypothetical protein
MAKCYILACATCDGLFEATRKGKFICSPRCRAYLKRHPEKLEELRDLCELTDGVTPFMVLQARALQNLTDCIGTRVPPDFEDRFWTGDPQPQERSALAAAVIQTRNGSQHEDSPP